MSELPVKKQLALLTLIQAQEALVRLEQPWMGLPCTPRSTVRYFGKDEIVVSEDRRSSSMRYHACARSLQSSLSPHEEAAELLRMLREQPDPCATVRHLLGETVVGASDAGDQMAELAITRNRTCAKRPSTDWAAPILTLTLPPSPLPPFPPLTAFACTSRLVQQPFFTRSLPNDGNQGRLTFRPDRRRNAWIACFALPSRMWPPRPALICSPHACRAEPSLLRENHPPR